MPDDEPLELDEPHEPRFSVLGGAVYGVTKWVLLGICAVFTLWAMNATWVQAVPIVLFACLFAGLARIAQAEQHRRD